MSTVGDDHVTKFRWSGPVVLKSGKKFASLCEFSLACGFKNKNTVSMCLKRGETIEEIASRCRWGIGFIKPPDEWTRKRTHVKLSDGREFASLSDFSVACGYASVAGVRENVRRGLSFDAIAKLRGIM